MKEKIEQIKRHVQENKKTYITGATCLAVGAFSAAILLPQGVVVDSFKIQWKTVTNNEVTTVMARRGHPGNVIKCNQTGELFASQTRAASLLGISASNLSQHLNGKYANAGGYTFTKLGEAQAA